MKFQYSGYSQAGANIAGTIEARDRQSARDALRREGTIVLKIEEKSDSSPSAPSTVHQSSGQMRRKRVGTGSRLRRVCMFARQLQVLLASGTPILQSLSAVQRQGDSAEWRGVLGDVCRKLEEGSQLSEGLRTHPEYFDALTLSLVSAGEASGNMSAMFERLSTLTRKQLQLRSAIIGALVYPCVLLSIGALVLCAMLLFVLPRFEDLFKQIDGPLPVTTSILLDASLLMRTYWWTLPPALIVCATASIFALKKQSVRDSIGLALLRLPKLGPLFISIATARLSRMLGTLLECKVPLLDALELTQQSLNSRQYSRLVQDAHESVTRGEAISAVFTRSKLISPCVQEAIQHGEVSGQLGAPLVQMADFLDEENDVIVKTITRLLEPSILAVLGVVVGVIAMSMFLPLFDLISSANGGH